MTLRWEAGERPAARDYRARFPDLADDAYVAAGGPEEFFCLREEAGETPDPGVFLGRHTEVAQALRRVLDIHGLVGSGTNLVSTGGMSTLSLSRHENCRGIAFPAAGETIAGFCLMEEIGRGAFARVFRALERQLADRPVALKVARTGSREPQTLARLQHTHIVPVYSYRTDPVTGLHLLCMPFYGRVTLSRAGRSRRGRRRGAVRSWSRRSTGSAVMKTRPLVAARDARRWRVGSSRGRSRGGARAWPKRSTTHTNEAFCIAM